MALPSPDRKAFWTGRKAFAVILVLVLVAAAIAGGLFVYHPLQFASNLSPDFKASTTTPQNIAAGSVEKTMLTATAINGFNSQVSFALHPAAGLSCQASSNTIVLAPNNPVELDCTSNTAGAYLLTVTVTSGSTSHVTTVTFTFSAPLSVTVKGSVKVTDGEIPSDIKFAQGTVFRSTLLSSAGNYSIPLPNFSSYNVTVENAVQGSCNLGVLDLRDNSTGLLKDYSCQRFQYPTTTSGSCDLQFLFRNVTFVTCTATVIPSSSQLVVATGQVAWSLSDPRFSLESPSCMLNRVGTSNDASCTIGGRVISRLSPSQYGTLQVNLTISYLGDASHLGSMSGPIRMTISPPPQTVAVAGTATSNTLPNLATGLEFTDMTTQTIYKAPVTSGMYDVTLTNLRQYKVTLFYVNSMGAMASCSVGTLTLQTGSSTWTADYSC